MRHFICAGLTVWVAGCSQPTHRVTTAPPFAVVPYDPFAREAAIAVALREWRAFGSLVDDDPPGSRPEPDADAKPERQEGLWQRVGEYWYTGQPADAPETRWTGKHDGAGHAFPARHDGRFAWSAAFISYVMRVAAAGESFPYAPNHSTYIDIARQMSRGELHGYDVSAERPEAYAPRPGDLICTGRAEAAGMRYDDLPVDSFPSHCDIVVSTSAGVLEVIGGNVDDAVTLKHVPVGSDGRLVGPAGLIDTRYPWFVVLRVMYAR